LLILEKGELLGQYLFKIFREKILYLKKLEFHGFKSFADKTELAIPPGITAIVGPNGCGKTNIVDAIGWVLGEQSARQLRGYKMGDFIFNGSAARPPSGMAEVSLTFDNQDGFLPLEFSEVMFTRRVYRSGESQYFINKKICRLRDINEIILGTGLGTRSYSLVEQGRIDQILRSRPEERRLLLEEAAGISKFRKKKEEALRKLEATESNLLRLKDVIREVKRQLGVSEKQARQAERYRKLRDRLKEQEINLSLLRLSEIKSRQRELETEKKSLEEDYSVREREIGDLESEYFGLRNKLREKESELNRLRTERITAEAEAGKAEHKIRVNQEQCRDLEERTKRLTAEGEALESGLSRKEEDLNRLARSLEEIKKSNAGKADKLHKAEEKLQEVRHRLSSLEKKLREGQDKILEFSRSGARIKNEFSRLQEGGKEIVLRSRKLEVELEKIQAEEKGIGEEREKLTAACKRAGEKVSELKSALNRREEAMAEIEKELISLSDRSEKLNLSLRKKQVEKDVLKDWSLLTGTDSDSRKLIMEEAARDGEMAKGVVGPLTDLIEVEPGFERAAEAALGNNLEAIVVERDDDAVRGINYLKKKKASRARFIVVELLKKNTEAGRHESRGREILKRIKFLKPLDGLGRELISPGELVDDISRGIAKGGQGFFFTRQGEVINPRGIIDWIGEGNSSAELFSRRRRLGKLEEEIRQLRDRAGETETALKSRSVSLREVRDQVEDLRKKLPSEELSAALKKSELEKNQQAIKSLEQNRDTVRGELASLSRQQEEMAGLREKLKGKLDQEKVQDEQVSADLKSSREELEKFSGENRRLESETTELKIELASSREREEAINERHQLLLSEVDEDQNALAGRRTQAEGSGKRKKELEEETESLKTWIETERAKLVKMEESIASREKEVDLINREYEEKEKSYQKVRPRLQEAQARLSEGKLRLTELRLQADAICQKIQDKFTVNLEGMKVPEDIPEAGVLEEEIEKLNLKMEKMSNVNLAALESKENFEDRLKHLLEQKSDLEAAQANIESAIKKINVTAREKLSRTFEVVRDHFRQIFSRLFEGGRADLILDNEADILESGMDIVAQPPGKKLSNISLLSGGEKALTTIALIFSLFKVQPSPFYLLDEIDAPLDEANIGRFIELLKGFVSESQFLVITHNKRSISAADVLYGITMEESGVSKVVSVKFKH